MINFLQAHVSQLTQSISQFAIKPGDEEIKKKGLVAVLEMTRPSLSPRDRIPWILATRGRKMERSRLRRCAEMRYADLDPILLDQAREGRIMISDKGYRSLQSP
jgi:hypothetical protein